MRTFRYDAWLHRTGIRTEPNRTNRFLKFLEDYLHLMTDELAYVLLSLAAILHCRLAVNRLHSNRPCAKHLLSKVIRAN